MEDQLWNPSVVDTAVSTSDFSWWGLFGTIVVFLAMLVAAFYIIRRLNGNTLRSMNTPWAKILDRQVLANQQTLYLVEIAGKLQVLAGTDHHITKISDIDDPEVAADILAEIANRPTDKVTKTVGRWGSLGRKHKADFGTELERLLEEVQK